MAFDTLAAQEKANNAVTEMSRLASEQVFNKLTGYINESELTFWQQLENFLLNKGVELLNNDIKATVLDIAEKNIINIEPRFENKKVNDIRFFATTDQLSSILNDAFKNYMYITNDEYRNEYEQKLEKWEFEYKKAIDEFEKSVEYKEYSEKFKEYKEARDKGKANVNKPKKPKIKFRTKPEIGREPTRYQAIFIGYVLNCSVEEVENIFLKKALNQRGFNLKNPLDAICYWGLKQPTNKYGSWLDLKEKFSNMEVRQSDIKKESVNTLYAKTLAHNNDDFNYGNLECVCNYIIENMYISDEVYDKISNNNNSIVFGKEIISYCIKRYSNDVDCFSGSSVAALNEFKNLLMSKYRNNIKYFNEQIKKAKETEKSEKDKLIKSRQYSNTDMINLINQFKSINKKYQKIYVELQQALTQQKYAEYDFEDDMLNNESLEEESDIMSGELYKSLFGSLTDLHHLKSKGFYNEPILSFGHLQELLNKNKSVERGDIILAAFYINAISLKRKSLNPLQRVKEFEKSVNGFLVRSGFSKLYYPNPYEALLAIIISTDFPLLALSEIMLNNIDDYIYVDDKTKGEN